MEAQATASLSAPLLEGEIGAHDSGSPASISHSASGTGAPNAPLNKDEGIPVNLTGERPLVPNEMWVDIGEEMTKPMAGRVVRRATQVNEETAPFLFKEVCQLRYFVELQ